ncbi:MAG: hypothetical protein HY939_01090 [Gammaproteobacteria bacterium]|nr:hypothetical protein [Gammaproteobacteria bacterium]
MKINLNRIFFVLTLCLSLFLAGCASNTSPNTYESSEVGVARKVLSGTVIGRRAVKVDNNSGVGGLAGTAAGAAAGSAIGGDSTTHLIGAIGGAVVGGVVGNAADKGLHQQQGFEYIIKMKKGLTISIVQVQEVPFEINQPVLVVYGEKTRVIPDSTVPMRH